MKLVVNGEVRQHSNTSHMHYKTAELVSWWSNTTLEPGDVIVTNDPYITAGMASHLPDLHLIRPYFHEGQIVGYGWLFIHYMDVGGKVPGSVSESC